MTEWWVIKPSVTEDEVSVPQNGRLPSAAGPFASSQSSAVGLISGVFTGWVGWGGIPQKALTCCTFTQQSKGLLEINPVTWGTVLDLWAEAKKDELLRLLCVVLWGVRVGSNSYQQGTLTSFYVEVLICVSKKPLPPPYQGLQKTKMPTWGYRWARISREESWHTKSEFSLNNPNISYIQHSSNYSSSNTDFLWLVSRSSSRHQCVIMCSASALLV